MEAVTRPKEQKAGTKLNGSLTIPASLGKIGAVLVRYTGPADDRTPATARVSALFGS